MIFDFFIKLLGWIWLSLSIIVYMALAISIVGVIYGVLTGNLLSDLWL